MECHGGCPVNFSIFHKDFITSFRSTVCLLIIVEYFFKLWKSVYMIEIQIYLFYIIF